MEIARLSFFGLFALVLFKGFSLSFCHSPSFARLQIHSPTTRRMSATAARSARAAARSPLRPTAKLRTTSATLTLTATKTVASRTATSSSLTKSRFPTFPESHAPQLAGRCAHLSSKCAIQHKAACKFWLYIFSFFFQLQYSNIANYNCSCFDDMMVVLDRHIASHRSCCQTGDHKSNTVRPVF